MKIHAPLFGLVFLVFVAGCYQAKVPNKHRALLAQLDRQYDDYLNGNCEQAERAMKSSLTLIATLPTDCNRANLFWLTYARLYCIQITCGKQNDAWVSLEKCRYWRLVDAECSGDIPAKVKQCAEKTTSDYCKAMVMKWDATYTDGKGANFWKEPKGGEENGK